MKKITVLLLLSIGIISCTSDDNATDMQTDTLELNADSNPPPTPPAIPPTNDKDWDKGKQGIKY